MPGVLDLSTKVTAQGVVTEELTGSSQDGKATIHIPVSTRALTAEGKALAKIITQVVTSSALPSGNRVIGPGYNFGPDGATFESPIDMTIAYAPDLLPEGVAEEELVTAYYDTAAGKWIELKNIMVNTGNHTITGKANHFTLFAVLAAAAPGTTWWIWLIIGVVVAGLAAYFLVRRRILSST